MFSAVRVVPVVAASALSSAISLGYSYVMQEQQKQAMVEMNQAMVEINRAIVTANTKLWVDVTGALHGKAFHGVGVTVAASAILLGYRYVHKTQRRSEDEKDGSLAEEEKEWGETEDEAREEHNIITEDKRREERIQLVTNDFRYHCNLGNQRPRCDCCECVSQKGSIQ